jgi:hypothetical protein
MFDDEDMDSLRLVSACPSGVSLVGVELGNLPCIIDIAKW